MPFEFLPGRYRCMLNPILRGGIGYLQQKNHTFAEIVWDLHEPLISHEEYKVILLKME